MEAVKMTMERITRQSQSMALSYDPIESEKRRVEYINSTPGPLKDYDCPLCQNRGYFMRLRNDGSKYTKACGCIHIRGAMDALKKSGLEKVIRSMTFDNYKAREPWQIKLKQGAMTYAKHPEGWFAIFGQSGCGKTHLCTAICREFILQQKALRYLSWRDEISTLKGLYGDENRQKELLDKFKAAQVLYIDDLFKTGSVDGSRPRPTAADVQIAFEILNYRSINGLCTILSSEMLLDEIIAMDEATGGRIKENSKGNLFVVSPNQKRNYRLQHRW